MIEVLIALFLTGSMAEKQYITAKACEADYSQVYDYEFNREADFVYIYEDKSTITINAITGELIVHDEDGKLVHSEKK